MTDRVCLLAFLAGLAGTTPSAMGKDFQATEVAELTASDAAFQSRFGWSVALDGDTLIAGSRPPDNNGSAYVFRRNHGGADEWQELVELAPADSPFGTQFGMAVSLDGDLAVAGAPGDDAKGMDAGAVYLFQRNKGGADKFGQVKKILAEDGKMGDELGAAVAVSGDLLAAGARLRDAGGQSAGAVYLFRRNQGGKDAWGQVAVITASDAAEYAELGGAVALSGDRLVAGARFALAGSTKSGAAYVFERNAGGADEWGQVAQLFPANPTALQGFGSSVSVSADRVLVGAPGDMGVVEKGGAAYLFERNHGGADAFGQVAVLVPKDVKQLDQAGQAVSLSGDVAVITARGDDEKAIDAGASYVFARNEGGADAWKQVAKLTASSAGVSDDLGWSVSADGDIAAAGAYKHDGAGSDAGAVFVHTWKVDDFVQQAKLYIAGSQKLGSALAASSDVAVVAGSDATYVLERNAGGPDAWGKVQKRAAGTSVAIAGSVAVVGDSAGAVARVLARNQGGKDQWGVAATLSGPAGFGRSVAASFALVAVGASGTVALHERNAGGAGAWGQVKAISGAGDFGAAVALAGDLLFIGQPSQSTVFVHAQNQGGSGQWGQVASFPGPTGFGATLSADGDILAAGAPLQSEIRIHSRNKGGADAWGMVAKRNGGLGFGASLAARGDVVVAGEPGAAGVVSVLSRNTAGADTWGLSDKLMALDGAPGGGFGVAVAAAPRYVLVGASGGNTVYLFATNEEAIEEVVAADDAYQVEKGKTLSVPAPGVLGNDKGKGLSAKLSKGATEGTLVLAGDGSFTYTPLGTAGDTDTFSYQAAGPGGAASLGVVTIHIAPADLPPVAVDDVATAYGTGLAAIAVLDNDEDEKPAGLVVTAVTQPAGGATSVAKGGKSVSYAASPGFHGDDVFTYTVSDGKSTATAKVTVSVHVCGDGHWDGSFGEGCDDGDNDDLDGCDAQCHVEPGFECAGAGPQVCASTCGDGIVASDEECDDHNTLSGDCCSPGCEVAKAGVVCRPAYAVCDVPEKCDGASGLCPEDLFAKAGTPCRAQKPFCDVPESCTGAYATCPPDLPAADGAPCDDGDPCTLVDACSGGACKGAPGFTCDDGNACTTGDHYECDECVGKPLDCDDGNPCTTDLCDPKSGCVPKPNDALCDDGNPCTKGDKCAGGKCVAGPPLACDDGNACTDDSCDAGKGCIVSPNAAPCDDGNPCTTGDVCDDGTCEGDIPPTECDDGNACTTNDTMECDKCKGTPVDCDDDNPCTTDGCLEQSGCVHEPDDEAECDDESACTKEDHCSEGKCTGSAVECDDANPCTVDDCDDGAGCQSKPGPAAPCDDGDPCTSGDTCTGGACLPGTGVPDCSDANPCTKDVCSPETGCDHVPDDQAPCDDGDPCTAGDSCSAGECQAGAPLKCPEGEVCAGGACIVPCGPATAPKAICKDEKTLHECSDEARGFAWTEIPCPEGTACIEGRDRGGLAACVEVCSSDTDPKTRCTEDKKGLLTCSQNRDGAWTWKEEPCGGEAGALSCAFDSLSDQFVCCSPACEGRQCGAPPECEVSCGECARGTTCCLPGDECAAGDPGKAYQCLDGEGEPADPGMSPEPAAAEGAPPSPPAEAAVPAAENPGDCGECSLAHRSGSPLRPGVVVVLLLAVALFAALRRRRSGKAPWAAVALLVTLAAGPAKALETKVLLVGYSGQGVPSSTKAVLEAAGATVTTIETVPAPSISTIAQYDILWVHGSDIPFGTAAINQIRSWVFAGGSLVVQQPNSIGPVTLFPTGFEVEVTSDTGNWFSWEVQPVVLAPPHPIVKGLTGLQVGTSLDMVPLSSVGSQWTILARGKNDPSYIGLLAGSYGKGRLLFSSGSLVSGQWWSAGASAFVQNLLGWLNSLAQSCEDWYQRGFWTDGPYLIDPNGGSTSDAFTAYCDMTRNGGGWTLVLRAGLGADITSPGLSGAYGPVPSSPQNPGDGVLQKLSDATINQIMTSADDPSGGESAGYWVTTPGSGIGLLGAENFHRADCAFMMGQTSSQVKATTCHFSTVVYSDVPDWKPGGHYHDNSSAYRWAFGYEQQYDHGTGGYCRQDGGGLGTHTPPYTAFHRGWCNTAAWGLVFARKGRPTARNTKAQAAHNCQELFELGFTQSGRYWIDPNGDSTDDAFLVHCDQERHGGGWTLVLRAGIGADLTAGDRTIAIGIPPVKPTQPNDGEIQKLSDMQINMIRGNPAGSSIAYWTTTPGFGSGTLGAEIFNRGDCVFQMGQLSGEIKKSTCHQWTTTYSATSPSWSNGGHWWNNNGAYRWAFGHGCEGDYGTGACYSNGRGLGAHSGSLSPFHRGWCGSVRGWGMVFVKGAGKPPGGLYKNTKETAEPSCYELLQKGYKVSGRYWIDPDGGSTSNAFLAYCDMTSNGGGWTLVLRAGLGHDLTSGDKTGAFGGAPAEPTRPADGTLEKLSDAAINQLVQNPAADPSTAVSASYWVTTPGDGFGTFGAENFHRGDCVFKMGQTSSQLKATTCHYSTTQYRPDPDWERGGHWWDDSTAYRWAFGYAFEGHHGTAGYCSNDGAGLGPHAPPHAPFHRGWCSTAAWGLVYARRALPVALNLRAGAAHDCQELLDDGHTASGRYWIDPNGGEKDDSILVYCDQERHGGGWTLALRAGPVADLTVWDGARNRSVLSGLYEGAPARPTALPSKANADGLQWIEKLDDMHINMIRKNAGGNIAYWTTTPGDGAGTLGAEIFHRGDCQFKMGQLSGELKATTCHQWTTTYSTSPSWSNGGHWWDNSGGYRWAFGHGCEGDHGTGACYSNGRGLGAHSGSLSPFHRGWCGTRAWGLVFVKGRGKKTKTSNTQATAGPSCYELLQAGYTESGRYWIDPNGGSTADAFMAYCDQSSNGGGWTLVLRAGHGYDLTSGDKTGAIGGVPTDPTQPPDNTLQKLSDAVINELVQNPAADPSKDESASYWVTTPSAGVGLFGAENFHRGDCTFKMGQLSSQVKATTCHYSTTNYLLDPDWEPGGHWWDDSTAYRWAFGYAFEGHHGTAGYCPADGTSLGTHAPPHAPFHMGWCGTNQWGLVFVRRAIPIAKNLRNEAAHDCQELYEAGHKTSGRYWIDPNGGNTADSMLVYCDQEHHGGGWTLVLRAGPEAELTGFDGSDGRSNISGRVNAYPARPTALPGKARQDGTQWLEKMDDMQVNMIRKNAGGNIAYWTTTPGNGTGLLGAEIFHRGDCELKMGQLSSELKATTCNQWTTTYSATSPSWSGGGHWWNDNGAYRWAFGHGCEWDYGTGACYSNGRGLGAHSGTWRPFHRGGCSVRSWGLVFVKGRGTVTKDSNTKETAVASCLELSKLGYTESGQYWIDPDGGLTTNAFLAYCDQKSHGGGWTLVLRAGHGYDLASGDKTGAFGGAPPDPSQPPDGTLEKLSDATISQIVQYPGTDPSAGSSAAYWVTTPCSGTGRYGAENFHRADCTFKMGQLSSQLKATTCHYSATAYALEPDWEPGGHWWDNSTAYRWAFGYANEGHHGTHYCAADGTGLGSHTPPHAPFHRGWCGTDAWGLVFARRGQQVTMNTKTQAGHDCQDLLVKGHTTSGRYWINPGNGPIDNAIMVYCNQEHHGGGWTLALRAGLDQNLTGWDASGSQIKRSYLPYPVRPAPLPVKAKQDGQLWLEKLSDMQVNMIARNKGTGITYWTTTPGDGAGTLGAEIFHRADCAFKTGQLSTELKGKTCHQWTTTYSATSPSWSSGGHWWNDNGAYRWAFGHGCEGNYGTGACYSNGRGLGAHAPGWAPFHRGWCGVKSWGVVYVKGRGTVTTNTQPGAQKSCLALLQAGWQDDGVYWIDPNGGSTSDAFQAYCDQTSHGGGWTLVLAAGHGFDLTSGDRTGAFLPYPILPDNPGDNVLRKMSDATVNQIRTSTGSQVGYWVTSPGEGEGRFGAEIFHRADCTFKMGQLSSQVKATTCHMWTTTFSASPSWSGGGHWWNDSTGYRWAFGYGCEGHHGTGGCYANGQNLGAHAPPHAPFHRGWCGTNNWGMVYVR